MMNVTLKRRLKFKGSKLRNRMCLEKCVDICRFTGRDKKSASRRVLLVSWGSKTLLFSCTCGSQPMSSEPPKGGSCNFTQTFSRDVEHSRNSARNLHCPSVTWSSLLYSMIFILTLKLKIMSTLEQATKAQRGSRCIALLFR
jgi:hypothetical protein